MFDELQPAIRHYLQKEVSLINKPKNPGNPYFFKDLNSTIDLLFQLLDQDIPEITIQRVKDNFYTHIPKILDFQENELPTAIEGLATNFEPFLKLIGYLKYQGSDLWYGDGLYSEGLVKTTLSNLYLAEINNRHNAPEITAKKLLPEPLVNYSGTKRSVLDFIRTELRNAVHNAKNYTRIEVVQYSNIVLAGYLIAIEDNIEFLKQCFLDEYQYLKKIFSDPINQNLQSVYVDLLGSESVNEIDVIGSEVIDDAVIQSELNSYSFLSDNTEDNKIDPVLLERRIDSILTIAKDTKTFQIIGKPGAGKSTTLLKILYNNASEILDGNTTLKIPFYLNANEYRRDNGWIDMISKILGKEWIMAALASDRIQLLLDGLNEIPEQFKQEAYTEVTNLLKYYPEISIILSERKVNFKRRFELPVFELKDLNNDQILKFIQKYSRDKAKELWKQLQKNESMMQLAYNPLMLKMILVVSKKGEIPTNRGLLFQTFIQSIFEREKVKHAQTDSRTKIDILSYTAFQMKYTGLTSVPESRFKHLVSVMLNILRSQVDINLLYNELLDNLIIKISNDEVSFVHETYQEYFCALQIKGEFEINGRIPINTTDQSWFEVLLISGELFKSKARAIEYFQYLYGGEHTGQAKKFIEFGNQDFNQNIEVALKVAYAIKDLKPEIFKLAETYLSNYLQIWKYIYYSKAEMIAPIETIFSAVASLNSSKIIFHIITNKGWSNIWLSELTDTDFNVDSNKFIVSLNSRSEKIEETISNHTPNFATFYNIVTSVIFSSYNSSTIIRLKKLQTALLLNQSENQLKSYFEHFKDFDVYTEILKNDLSYLQNYRFEKNYPSRNEQVMKTLIRNHLKNETARNVISSQIKTLRYDRKVILLFLSKLDQFELHDPLLELLEFLLIADIKSFEQNTSFLRNISFQLLSPQLKRYYYSAIELPPISFQLNAPGSLRIRSEFRELCRPNTELWLSDNIAINITDCKTFIYKENDFITLYHPQALNLYKKLASKGKIYYYQGSKPIRIHYKELRLDRASSTVIFKASLITVEVKTTLLKKRPRLFVEGKSDWVFKSVRTQEERDNDYLSVTYVSNAMIQTELTKTDELRCFLPLDLKKPWLYHPDLLSKLSFAVKFMRERLHQKTCKEFVSDLGVKHIFHRLIAVNYGIVISVNGVNVRIFCINTQIITSVRISDSDVQFAAIDRMVIIEDNNRIHFFHMKDSDYEKIGFISSQIIDLNSDKGEGFIINENSTSDFYFRTIDCKFEPEKGDFVRFIPARNPSKNHINKPMALRIEKIKLEKCKIVTVNHKEKRMFGRATDLITDSIFTFSINKESKFAFDPETDVSVDSIFEYILNKKSTSTTNNKIILTKLIAPGLTIIEA